MNAAAIKGLGSRVLPQFDRRSLPFYLMLAGSLGFVAIALPLSGLELSNTFNGVQLFLAGILISLATMLRRVGHDKISTVIETIPLVVFMASVLIAVQFSVSTFNRPLVDDLLVRADRVLGFDWLTFARMFSPAGLLVLNKAYFSMSQQAAVLIILSAWSGRTTRCWQFVTACFIFFLVATLSFPFFMADGRYVLCGLHPADIPVVGRLCDYGPILRQIHDGSIRVVQGSMVVGMVSFPSAHASAGLALTWLAWPNRWLRLPIAILNVGLCMGAIVIGSHYLIDIIGGLAVGAAAIWVAKLVVRDNKDP